MRHRQIEPTERTVAQHGLEHLRTRQEVQPRVASGAERTDHWRPFDRRAGTGEDDFTSMVAPEGDPVRWCIVGRDDVDRLLVALQRRGDWEVERTAHDRDGWLARQTVPVAPAPDVERLMRDANLEDVLELALGERA